MEHRSFRDLVNNEEILRALKGLGYDMPTEVQTRVIPLAIEKNDLIIKAQTGSGKTAAFAIPICEAIEWLENKPQALVLAPTRELAVQIKEEITDIGRFKRMKAVAVYGGHQFAVEKTELKQKTHVVVGTPGRVLDHMKKGTLNLTKLLFLVIDEGDRMLDMGFAGQVEDIVKQLREERTTWMLSATMTKEVLTLSTNYMRNPIHIDVSEDQLVTTDIDHALYIAEEEDKFELLNDLMITENADCCIIFCNTKERVDLIHRRLADLGYRIDKIHGGLDQVDRLSAMKRFKRGEYRYLVATDVAARGIDVEDISLVINYDIPLDTENYVHRTGRTGRAGQKGKAISFVASGQARYLQDIEKLIGFEITEKMKPTKEEVAIQKPSFDYKMKTTPQLKNIKSNQLNKDIMKLRFNAGKNKKLRATNFVGVISNIKGISADDIGIITILDTLTYVEILNGKGPFVLEIMKTTMIGGRLLKVSKSKD